MSRQRDTLFKKYYQDDNVIDYLENYNSDCNIYTTQATNPNELGKGAMAVIYKIKINNKPFALKQMPKKMRNFSMNSHLPKLTLDMIQMDPDERASIERNNPTITKNHPIAIEYIGPQIKYNIGSYCKIKQAKRIKKFVHFPYRYPHPQKPNEDAYMIRDPTKYPLNSRIKLPQNIDQIIVMDPDKYIMIPAGSYVCDNVYTEYVIMALLASIQKGNMSRHFLQGVDFNTCDQNINTIPWEFSKTMDRSVKTATMQYFAIELIDKSLDDLLKAAIRDPMLLTSNDYASIILQSLFAMATYQELYKINHSDLHTGNIFIKLIKPTAHQDTHYEYRIIKNNKILETYYIPISRYLVKIGDFGFACKYSKPIVAFNDVVIGSYPSVPNWYCPGYDVAFFFKSIYDAVYVHIDQIDNMDITFNKGKKKFETEPKYRNMRGIRKINEELLTEINNGRTTTMEYFQDRPKVSPYLDTLKSALQLLLTSKILEPFTRRPVNGSIRRNVYTLILA